MKRRLGHSEKLFCALEKCAAWQCSSFWLCSSLTKLKASKSVCNNRVLNAAMSTVSPVNSNLEMPYRAHVSGSILEWYANKTCFPPWIWNRLSNDSFFKPSKAGA